MKFINKIIAMFEKMNVS
ncbi:hypothetical protein YPPY19_2522, partial [Yersinia pestis PY-19]